MACGRLSAVALFGVITMGSAKINPKYGYGGTCVPGYDDDCDLDSETATPSEEASETGATTTEPGLLTTTAGNPEDDHDHDHHDHDHESSFESPTDLPGPSTSHHCQLNIPQQCVFPFHYKGLKYTTCTAVDAVSTIWCSTDRYFRGHWRECSDPCKNKWPVHAIVSGVVASGVAATGIGLIAASVAQKNHGHLENPFAGLLNPNAAAQATPVPPPTVPVPVPVPAPAAEGTTPLPGSFKVLQKPGPYNVGVAVESVPVELPARRRLAEAFADALSNLWSSAPARQLLSTPAPVGLTTPAPTPAPVGQRVDVPVGVLVSGPTTSTITTTMGNGEASGRLFWYAVIIGLVLCCCAACCGVAAALYGGFGKKKKGNTQRRNDYEQADYDDQPGYPNQYDQGFNQQYDQGYPQQYDQAYANPQV